MPLPFLEVLTYNLRAYLVRLGRFIETMIHLECTKDVKNKVDDTKRLATS